MREMAAAEEAVVDGVAVVIRKVVTREVTRIDHIPLSDNYR